MWSNKKRGSKQQSDMGKAIAFPILFTPHLKGERHQKSTNRRPRWYEI